MARIEARLLANALHDATSFITMKSGNTPLARTLTAAASGTALFTLPHTTDAAVIYSGAANTVIAPFFFSSSTLVGLDINGGGFDFNNYVLNPGKARLDGRGPNVWLGLSANTDFVRKLPAGFTIGAAAGPWNTAVGYLNFGGVGQWLAGETGFAGLRVPIGGGNYNYGWIRMRVDDVNPDDDGAVDTLTIIDYAYESTPNSAITSGQTVDAVPEPGNALFALAVAGAAAVRRQRRAA